MRYLLTGHLNIAAYLAILYNNYLKNYFGIYEQMDILFWY